MYNKIKELQKTLLLKIEENRKLEKKYKRLENMHRKKCTEFDQLLATHNFMLEEQEKAKKTISSKTRKGKNARNTTSYK